MNKIVSTNLAYRLLNHGPTILVSARHNGKQNIMAAAWACALDFDPPKITVVIDKSTYTRELIEASGTFAINVPCVAQVDIVRKVGTTTGRDLKETDKFAEYGLETFSATTGFFIGLLALIRSAVFFLFSNDIPMVFPF